MFDAPGLQQDIFSSLGKYCTGQLEHYTVEAFAVLLNLLLITDRDVAVDVLNRLISTADSTFDATDDIKVIAQLPAGIAGTPDITIRCKDKLVFIEAKVESAVDSEQLHRYKSFLESSGTKLYKLVLLTKYYPDLEGLEKQIKEVRWSDVRQWFLETEARVRHAERKFILNSFTDFLKEGAISMERVNSDFIMLKYSLPQLRNLLDIMDGISKEVGGTNTAIGKSPWGWAGFYLSKEEFAREVWFGTSFTHPLDLTFEINPAKAYDVHMLEISLLERLPPELRKYQKDEYSVEVCFRWNLEERAFFSLGRQDQIEMVRTLVKITWDAARASKVHKET